MRMGCDAYQPWHDKQTHKTFIRPDSGKCLRYYFYFIDIPGHPKPAEPEPIGLV
jgi:hypothetical protein